MNKELFKVLANKIVDQNNVATLIEALSESEAFSSDEFDNMISLLAGAYKVPVIKETAKLFGVDQVEIRFKSFNKVKMRVSYTYKSVKKLLEHNGDFLTKWEAERKGLAEEFKANAMDRISDEIHTDSCSYDTWAKYQCGNVVVID